MQIQIAISYMASCKIKKMKQRFSNKLYFYVAKINPVALLLIVSWDYQANVT